VKTVYLIVSTLIGIDSVVFEHQFSTVCSLALKYQPQVKMLLNEKQTQQRIVA